PWKGGDLLGPNEGGWPVVGPSPVPFNANGPLPIELDAAGLERVAGAFVAAAQRALKAGFDLIELHSAHGYLFHSFLSPISNRRTDAYGGSLDNRTRLLLEVTKRVRAVIPESMPLFVRISATDWVEGGWDGPQSVELAKRLKAAGVDLIDVSGGGTVPVASIPLAKGYQVPFAADIRREAGIATGAVGLITEPGDANDIICRGDADLIFIGRQLLREPYWAIRAQTEMDAEPTWPLSYGYAVRRRTK
ncbi:MAG: oxidoreductase, partial [Planctomycetia bacterium]